MHSQNGNLSPAFVWLCFYVNFKSKRNSSKWANFQACKCLPGFANLPQLRPYIGLIKILFGGELVFSSGRVPVVHRAHMHSLDLSPSCKIPWPSLIINSIKRSRRRGGGGGREGQLLKVLTLMPRRPIRRQRVNWKGWLCVWTVECSDISYIRQIIVRYVNAPNQFPAPFDLEITSANTSIKSLSTNSPFTLHNVQCPRLKTKPEFHRSVDQF